MGRIESTAEENEENLENDPLKEGETAKTTALFTCYGGMSAGATIAMIYSSLFPRNAPLQPSTDPFCAATSDTIHFL